MILGIFAPFTEIGLMLESLVQNVFYYEVTWDDVGTFRLIDPMVAVATLSMIVDIINYVVGGPSNDRNDR